MSASFRYGGKADARQEDRRAVSAALDGQEDRRAVSAALDGQEDRRAVSAALDGDDGDGGGGGAGGAAGGLDGDADLVAGPDRGCQEGAALYQAGRARAGRAHHPD